ncbi:MAG: OsmC family protein, partial [Gemmataceae bacterium]
MNADELKAMQASIKQSYRDNPNSALKTMQARGHVVQESVHCDVESRQGAIAAGLHPAAGGDGSWACSGDMLLQALVGCAGTTLAAVATAMGITLKRADVSAEGVLDFRGTLGVSKETPVGFREIRLHFGIDAEAPQEQLETLVKLAKRYCVVWQTLAQTP